MVAISVHIDSHIGFLHSHFEDKGGSIGIPPAVIDFLYVETILFIAILLKCHNRFKIMA